MAHALAYQFDWSILTPADLEIAKRYVPDLRQPDLVIAGDHGPYLLRWHVVPRNYQGNVYFHIQLADDPERPKHDHPWDNQTVILSGGYRETYSFDPRYWAHKGDRECRVGDVITRQAAEAHRLELLPGVPYTMTQFTTGPAKRSWGFWINGIWYHNEDCLAYTEDGSTFTYPEGVKHEHD